MDRASQVPRLLALRSAMVWHGWQRIEISKNSPLGICVHWARYVLGLRASPRLLLGVCSLQLIVLVGSFLQLLSRSECAISLPRFVHAGVMILAGWPPSR